MFMLTTTECIEGWTRKEPVLDIKIYNIKKGEDINDEKHEDKHEDRYEGGYLTEERQWTTSTLAAIVIMHESEG